ncbi:MAG: hypothetical protein WBV82_16450, partial [Myxococcaceae bacterium]
MIKKVGAVIVSGALMAGCAHQTEAKEPAAAPAEAEAPAKPTPKYDQLGRKAFNQKAVELALPLFWRTDANANGTIDPDELVTVWGIDPAKREDFVGPEGFTPRFADAYARMTESEVTSGNGAGGIGVYGSGQELKRLQLAREELAQGAPTLVETNLKDAPEQDRKIVQHILAAAEIVERLHAKQKGVFGMAEKIPASDTASRALFFRNQGPDCEAPKTENDPACSALTGAPKVLSGLYPASIQADPKFCDSLAAQPNGSALMDHFSVVREVAGKPGTFEAVPYNVAYKEDMEAVSRELKAAADAITSADEAPFKAYLNAAAQSFLTNDWEPANEAWAAMGVDNSKWYLRIGPDEVYYEPCAWKAGFHVSFARINPDSLNWQKKLEPVKGDMEKALAALAGPPYKARDVKFKLPDFIDIVLNAGDARPPHGATIGQSLPNWGKVAAKGGRTVAMTNLYTDADSQAVLRDQVASLYCPATMAGFTTEPAPALMSTVLHEAAHNLGPSHEYKVKGKVDDEIFGGPLASMMEELKAQTAALYYSEWLVERGVITADEAQKAHLRDVAWGFGHVSRGMYTADGNARPYSQLASIQLGTLFKAGVLQWKPEQKAANGADVGCFEIDLAKWKVTGDALAKRVLKAKGKGDKADAEKMKAEFVDADGEWKKLREV